MSQDADSLDHDLKRHREYLCLLARKHLNRHLWPRIDPSDVVQNTLCDAHRKREQWRGVADSQLRAWLRTMLLHDLADAIRKISRLDAREPLVLEALNQSNGWIKASLAAEHTSPSQQAVKHEQLQRLADALAQLPESERLAIELHHLHDWPLAEVAEYLKRSPPAIAGLLHRGLRRLRKLLPESE